MGAVVFTPSTTDATGRFNPKYIDNQRVVIGTLTMSSSYATGGDTLSLSNLDIKEVNKLLIENNALTMSGLSYRLAGTKTAPLIIVADANNSEVANGTNLSARQTCIAWLFGA